MREILTEIFNKLNDEVESENGVRRKDGVLPLRRSKIEILGQTSLLAQPDLTYSLSLAQTGDVDALIKADHFVKQRIKAILPTYGLIYDEDSPLIFIPKGSQFLPFLSLQHIEVLIIDPESALVSKAVKAPKKICNLSGKLSPPINTPI